MTNQRINILIRGWRFLPHSYAIVNQFQCLELARRPDLTLYFEDVPFYSPDWNSARGLLSAEDEEAIEHFPPLPPGLTPDVEFRIAYPYDLSSLPMGKRVAVFGTAEYKAVPASYVAGQIPVRDALANNRELHVITPSNWSRDGFIASGADPSRVSLVPHGIEPELFYPPGGSEREAARASMGFGDDEFVFLTVGAMTGNKNPNMVMSAFAGVLRSHPRSMLILKGMDELYSSYQMFKAALAGALPGPEMALVLPRIRYIGKSLNFAEMASLYHAVDCYVTPYSAEAFNLPALEAAACGLPIICTAGGPTDDFTNELFARRIDSSEVVQENSGMLMTSLAPDAGHLEELMISIVGDTAFCDQARSKGAEFIHGHFTWKHAVDKLLEVLRPVI